MKNTREMGNSIFAMFLGLLVIAGSNQVFAQGDSWETLVPMPTARWAAAGGVIDGKFYVAGGQSETGTTATLEVYDPATGTWTAKAPMPAARSGVGGGVINGKLYVVGGTGPSSRLDVYDPAANTWATMAPMPTRRMLPGVVAIDGQLYVVGGCLGGCWPVTAVLEVYDPATNTWATKAPMPTARGVVDVAVVDGLFYVMGGCCMPSAPHDLMERAIEVYDPVTNTWTIRTQHFVGEGDTAGSIDGKIYVAKDTATEVYDPATDAWAPLSAMSIARYYAAGGVIDGKLYVAGGHLSAGSGGSAALEAFTPPNTPPTVTLGAHAGDEGLAIALNAIVSDADAGDTLTYAWSYAPVSGVDAGAACSFSDASSLTATITCTDDGNYKLTLTVNDGHNPAVSADSTLTVSNVAPTIPVLSAALADNTATAWASFTDAGANDGHTCAIDWGEGTTSTGAIAAKTCTASHTYAAPGTFTVKIAVTDDDGGTASASTPVTISPQGLQNGLVGYLDNLPPSGNKGSDARIDSAVKDLEQSLRDDLWLDESHLTKSGAKVFTEHKQAVEDLLKIKSPPQLIADAASSIESIVATDRMLSQTLRNDNKNGKAGEIAKADEELTKGDADAAAGEFVKAIEHYGKAWKHAYKAGA